MEHTFLHRPLRIEADINRHRLDVNPEVSSFHATDSAATEAEYLNLLAALIGIFNPTHLMETGTWNGDGAACLIRAAPPESTVLTLCDAPLGEAIKSGLSNLAEKFGGYVKFVQVNTKTLMDGHSESSWAELTGSKTTFAFLDSSIPDRAREFAYISDPLNGVLDFTRPLCVCIHDMSRYRHPHEPEVQYLAATLAALNDLCIERGWQQMRFHQSRGMLVLTKYPQAAGIDGTCLIPAALVSAHDLANHMRGSDPYLITDYFPVLGAIVLEQRPKRVLNIGIRAGYSLSTILDASNGIEKAYSIDLSQKNSSGTTTVYRRTQTLLEELRQTARWPHLRELTFWEIDSQTLTALPQEALDLDLTLIDGTYSAEGCLHNLSIALPATRNNGLIVVDNIDWHSLRSHVENWALNHGLISSYHPDSSGRGRLVVRVVHHHLEAIS